MDKTKNGDPMNSCIDVYKVNIQYDGSLDKMKLRIMVRRYLQNKYLIGDTWSPTVSMRALKYLLEYDVKHKAGVHQLDFIVALLQEKVKHFAFVKLDIRYAD